MSLVFRYVHGYCDPNADLPTYQQRKELYPDYEYICMPCKAAGTGLNTTGCNPRVLSAIKKASDKDDFSSESNSVLSNNFALSQDSLVFTEEESLAGTENSNDLSWAEKVSSALPLHCVRVIWISS
jgi:histone-lysine N-methyltransferase MLL3